MEIKGLVKSFNGKTVLRVSSLVLPGACTLALLGENGSGKSTLLRILAGLLKPCGGTVEHGGEAAPEFFYMPQKPYAFRAPAWKSAALGLSGTPKSKREAALSALKRVGLAEHSHKLETTLSGGMAQRIAFARLLLKPRGLVLMDEPTSAQDKEGAALIEQALIEYRNVYKPTVIIATHSREQALRLADYALYLKPGEDSVFGRMKDTIC